MESEKKVFFSNITRSNNKSKNNLYDILNVVPTKPLPENSLQTRSYINHHHCNFVPKSDKIYIPKKKHGQKVKTVRDIRRVFERDVYNYLPSELEKQKNMLMRKIRLGFSRDEKTKEFAKNMFKSDAPVTKSAWQMLMNINPEEHKFSSQYILWKGKSIQVNGSKGGQYKFIYKYDIGRIKKPYKQSVKNSALCRKIRLLQHSLNVKFKPGPLTKKKYLDVSYQKYQFGEIKLVDLPKAGLNIQTSYGKPLAPLIDAFLNKSLFQHNNGLISQQWANFAVMAVGKNKKGLVSQIDQDACITFDLNYKHFQRKILMRHDSDIINNVDPIQTTKKSDFYEQESTITSEINDILDKMLETVEISLRQDEMFTGEDEQRQKLNENTVTCNSVNQSNIKNKRKLGELGRLDVTVIRISDTSEKDDKNAFCGKDYCALGCICDSLNCCYNLKNHCGRVECMFKCKCDFSKYKYMNSFDNDSCSEIIPGLVNLDKKLETTLAKEEHKFHQTVIVRDDQSILLKPNRRHWKTSKKYADFYSNMNLKTKSSGHQEMSVVCQNLDLKTVEPWCMVHNLYKCFCKGKFTECGLKILDENKTVIEPENPNPKITTLMPENYSNVSNKLCEVINHINLTNDEYVQMNLRSRDQKDSVSDKKCWTRKEILNSTNLNKVVYAYHPDSCARVKTYIGRKYDDAHYHNTHAKISELEKNDKSLQKKIMTLINNDDTDNINPVQNIVVNSPSSLRELLSKVTHSTYDSKERNKRLPTKTKLVAWLESNYKQYKQGLEQGLVKMSLAPPQAGTLCLYSWDFILSRYRERKNYFLISKQKPFRIFMAINIRNSFFENCSDIRDINLADIDKYPVTVKNLLTNATDLKENFCILCGLSDCWELIGSVTKVRENEDSLQADNQIDQLIISDEKCLRSDTDDSIQDLEEMPITNDTEASYDRERERNEVSPKTEISKWFIMSVANDFSEIQFIKKGFFVKYDSVFKAINVARVSGKTVRLSSKKCNGDGIDPQFGIYAIPSNNDFCVFIGPYEKDENLGIETIKKVESTQQNLNSQFGTKGIWITTNKKDNMKVIDNPSMFVPSTCLQSENMITLESDSTVNFNTHSTESIHNVQNNKVFQPSQAMITKQIKPIKIRRTNGFYHLTPNGLKPLQSPDTDKSNNSIRINNLRNQLGSPKINRVTSMEPILKNKYKTVAITKPIAEIAPQMKLSNDENHFPKNQRKFERGMFVLKPEEINKRSFEEQIISQQTQKSQTLIDDRDEMSMDIEKFLETSQICSPPKEEIYVISDEESEESSNSFTKDNYKDVWIVCKNVDNLGWISGKRNLEDHLSFEFPGFKCSEFYPEKEAFMKISQILARKVYVPKHIELEWQVLQSQAEVKTSDKLESKHLCSDYILTNKGLWHKHDVIEKLKSLKVGKLSEPSGATSEAHSLEGPLKKKPKIISDFEETSNTLEEESSFLWDKTIIRKGEIFESFSTASEELRKELTEQLKCIKNDSED